MLLRVGLLPGGSGGEKSEKQLAASFHVERAAKLFFSYASFLRNK